MKSGAKKKQPADLGRRRTWSFPAVFAKMSIFFTGSVMAPAA
jgi:hypothetical protein